MVLDEEILSLKLKRFGIMTQLILHLVGDYLLQTSWMADNKTKRHWPAFVHAVVYSLPFLLLEPSLSAFLVILITHFFIDRYRLARFVAFAKNKVTTPSLHWEDCSQTGYHKDSPAWLSVWLLIITDNTMHLIINFCALRWL